MDVKPAPERKKYTALRATSEQLEILKAAFATSNVASLAALSEATGLTHKWISSWFTRERKKHPKTTAPMAAKVDTMAMSLEDIAAFKAETHDPPLSLTTNADVNQETETKSFPPASLTTETTGQPWPQGGNETGSFPDVSKTSNAASSPLKSPFVSAPPFRRPLPLALSPRNQAPSTSTTTSPSSTFIMRQMVPFIYMPHSSSSSLPILSEVSAITSVTSLHGNSDPPITTSASSSTSTAIADHSFSLPNYNNGRIASESTGTPPKRNVVYTSQFSLASSGTNMNDNNSNGSTTTTTTQDCQRGPLHPIEQSSPKYIIKTSLQNRGRNRSLRPLLPLYNPPRMQTNQSQYQDPCDFQHLRSLYPPPPMGAHTQTPSDRSTKENHPPAHYPRAAAVTQPQPPTLKPTAPGASALAPLFSRTNLKLARSTARQQQSQYSGLLSGYSVHSYAQPQFQSQPQPLHYDQNYYTHAPEHQHPGATLFDPTSTPMKHLDVLAPFECESLPPDEIMHRLLDERLAQEDPFQAAMGLVLVSRLGIGWDFS